MPPKRLSNIIGIDDAPFLRDHQGDLPIVGAVYAGLRFDGVIIGHIQKDGFDAAHRIVAMVSQSRFAQHAGLIMLQGITLGGFNVVDVHAVHQGLNLPVLVVARHRPDLPAFEAALRGGNIPQGERKWQVIQRLGPMEPMGKVYVQRRGLSREQTAATIRRFTLHSHIPEPIRSAHLIAGALVNGQSRGNP
jgi:endonuclease V-like protein UPF0215 family